jgi:hypothetical protein
MRLSAKTEYAAIAVLELARNWTSDEPVRIRSIAAAHGVPSRFLVQILLQLKGAGLVVIPLHNEPGLKFDYQIAMAVRHGDEARRQQLDKLIDKNQPKIDQILAEYGVPLLPLENKKRGGDDD